MLYTGKIKKLPKLNVAELNSLLGDEWEIRKNEQGFEILFNSKSKRIAELKVQMLNEL